MADPAKCCPDCGATLPEGALAGLCVACVLTMAKDAPTTRVSVPTQEEKLRPIGGYELLREIGRGGMGVVYEARQRGLNRLVALKLILAGEFASEEAVARFTEEAQVISRLDHPHIISIHEVGEHEGRHFYTMKLVRGDSLARCLAARSERVPSDRIPPTMKSGDVPSVAAVPSTASFLEQPRHMAEILVKIARAVHFVHQHGVLHRDLSPENILLDAAGEPWITDFGLSRLLDSDRRLTRSYTIVGKPDYMAPEQSDPRGPALSTATDLFSLGAIFYEMLTGQRPFAAATPMATMERARNDNPRPPSALNPSIDPDLDTICLKCLAKEPPGRYGSAEALAEDLERWLRGEPILARPVGALERSWKWMRRHPMKAVLALVSLLAVAGPLVTGLLLYRFVLPQQARSHVILGRDQNINGFALTFETNRLDRATMNFDLDMFKNRPHQARLYFTNMPPESLAWVSNLACQVFADIPGNPDKPRSPVLRHGDSFVLSRAEWADRAYYVAPFGWKGEEVLARAPNARLCITILDGDSR